MFIKNKTNNYGLTFYREKSKYHHQKANWYISISPFVIASGRFVSFQSLKKEYSLCCGNDNILLGCWFWAGKTYKSGKQVCFYRACWHNWLFVSWVISLSLLKSLTGSVKWYIQSCITAENLTITIQATTRNRTAWPLKLKLPSIKNEIAQKKN